LGTGETVVGCVVQGGSLLQYTARLSRPPIILMKLIWGQLLHRGLGQIKWLNRLGLSIGQLVDAATGTMDSVVVVAFARV